LRHGWRTWQTNCKIHFRSGAVDVINIQNAYEDRINVDSEEELKYWSKLLGISEDELRDVIRHVGNSAAVVALEIDKKKAA
jgi:hypothetical protein